MNRTEPILGEDPLEAFERALADLIGSQGIDKALEVPDYILAAHLAGCLDLFGATYRRALRNQDVSTSGQQK